MIEVKLRLELVLKKTIYRRPTMVSVKSVFVVYWPYYDRMTLYSLLFPSGFIGYVTGSSTPYTESVTPAGIPEQPRGGCVNYPCQHQGTCMSNGGSHFVCYCPRNYTGRFCESTCTLNSSDLYALKTSLKQMPLLKYLSNTLPIDNLFY